MNVVCTAIINVRAIRCLDTYPLFKQSLGSHEILRTNVNDLVEISSEGKYGKGYLKKTG
jgi:hypothetical protein